MTIFVFVVIFTVTAKSAAACYEWTEIYVSHLLPLMKYQEVMLVIIEVAVEMGRRFPLKVS